MSQLTPKSPPNKLPCTKHLPGPVDIPCCLPNGHEGMCKPDFDHQTRNDSVLAKVVAHSEPAKLTPIEAAHKYLELKERMRNLCCDYSVWQTLYTELLLEACALSGQFCEEWAKLAVK